MKKIENWNEIEAKGMDDFKSLPIGAYECVIKDARLNHNEETGKNTLKILKKKKIMLNKKLMI